jgi:DNA-binding transcriptional MerR regulator
MGLDLATVEQHWTRVGFGFSTEDASRITGLSQNRLQRWAARGWIPGQPRSVGHGTPRLWTQEQVEAVAQRLKDCAI